MLLGLIINCLNTFKNHIFLYLIFNLNIYVELNKMGGEERFLIFDILGESA